MNNVKNVFKLTLVLFSIVLLSACGNMPIPKNANIQAKKIMKDTSHKFDNEVPAIEKIKTKPLVVSQPKEFPASIRNKKVNIKLERGATLSDLSGVFQTYGLQLVVGPQLDSDFGGLNSQQNSKLKKKVESTVKKVTDNNGLPKKNNQQNSNNNNSKVSVSSLNVTSDTPLLIRKFKGSLSDYLVLLSELYDISFDYKGNDIVVMQKYSNYIVNLPQFPGAAKSGGNTGNFGVSGNNSNNSYGSNGNNSYGNNSYGNNSYGNNSYGNNSYGNNSYGNNSYGNNGSSGFNQYNKSSNNSQSGGSITKEIIENMKNLGAADIKNSMISGMVAYKATPFAQKNIYNYLKKMTKSVSVINIQAAIVTVDLNKHTTKGFDWSQMQLNLAKDLSNVAAVTAPSVISKNVWGSVGTKLSDMQGGAQFNPGAVKFTLMKGDFSFNSVINYLSSYGQTKTDQSVLMKTLSGQNVQLSSGQEVPYVSNLNSTAATGSNTISGGVNTNTVKTGVDLSVLPYFDNDNNIITASVNLTITNIVAYINLSAGNQVGNLSQPEVQEQKFQSVIRLKAGQATVIGGITDENMTDNRQGNSLISENNVSAKDIKTEKKAVFILLRPTVKVFSENF